MKLLNFVGGVGIIVRTTDRTQVDGVGIATREGKGVAVELQVLNFVGGVAVVVARHTHRRFGVERVGHRGHGFGVDQLKHVVGRQRHLHAQKAAGGTPVDVFETAERSAHLQPLADLHGEQTEFVGINGVVFDPEFGSARGLANHGDPHRKRGVDQFGAVLVGSNGLVGNFLRNFLTESRYGQP